MREPCAFSDARTVLGRGVGSNPFLLFDKVARVVLGRGGGSNPFFLFDETMDDDDRKPFEIPEDLFPELRSKPYDRKNLKMRTFRYNLPREIARQYFYAELFQIEGFSFLPYIESGSVIRKLLEKIEERLYSMEYVETFNTYPDPVEA